MLDGTLEAFISFLLEFEIDRLWRVGVQPLAAEYHYRTRRVGLPF